MTPFKKAELKVKSLLEEKEALIHEVHHRIKNNMNTIKSMLSIQANQLKSPEAKKALKAAENRISSMLVLYNQLYRTDNVQNISIEKYIIDLIDSIEMTEYKQIKINKYIDDVILNAKIIFPLGIIITELISNATKYAFDEQQANKTINVSVQIIDKTTTLIIHDNGKGFSLTKENEAFGLQLVKILSNQLNGEFQIQNDHGTKAILIFPI